MLCHLSLSHDNGHSRVIYHSSMKILRPLSLSHDSGQSMVIYHS